MRGSRCSCGRKTRRTIAEEEVGTTALAAKLWPLLMLLLGLGRVGVLEIVGAATKLIWTAKI